MGQIWRTYGDVLVAFAAVLPFAAAVVWALTRWRRRRGVPAAFRLSAAEVGIVVGTAPWIWMTMRPDPGGERRFHLVPLLDLLALDLDAVVVQVVGNLLVFAALGFFLPMRWPAFASFWRVVAVAAVGSSVIESLQYALDLGRVSSVDDVLVNTLGAGLAALLSRRWWLRGPVRESSTAANGAPVDA
ncbi:MAG TPA: VanZ family protein [Cryptosporangiaceae bacterium]|nr:VanZ family protein [Cryptosporangiaceae bacterium]